MGFVIVKAQSEKLMAASVPKWLGSVTLGMLSDCPLSRLGSSRLVPALLGSARLDSDSLELGENTRKGAASCME